MSTRSGTRSWRILGAVFAAFVLFPANGPAATLELSGQFTIASALGGSPDDEIAPAAAYDSTLDRYLVAWLAQDTPAGTVNIWARFVTADGVPMGAPFRAAAVGSGVEGRDARSVTIAYDEVRREYLIAAVGQPNASVPDHTEIYGQWLDDQGERIGEMDAISTVSAGSVQGPALRFDSPRQRFVIAYEAERPSKPGPTTFVQAFRRGSIDAPVPVFGGVSSQAPTLAVRPSDGTVFVAARDPDRGTVLLASVAPELGSEAPPVTWASPEPLGSGLQLGWHPTLNQGLLTWNARGDLIGVIIGSDGTFSAPGALAAAEAPASIGLAPISRVHPWLILTRDANGSYRPRAVGSELAPLVDTTPWETWIPSGAMSSDTVATALDTTRQWVLVPAAVRVGHTRSVVGRIATVREPPAATLLGFEASSPRCAAETQLYLLAVGTLCAAPATPAFSLAPLTDRRRQRLLGVVVRPTTRASRIRLECVARCGRQRTVKKRAGRPGATDLMLGRWRAPVGATVEIRVEQRDMTIRYMRMTRTRRFPFFRVIERACRLPIGVSAPC